MSAETKTLNDHIDDFELELVSAQSMLLILEILVLDANHVSSLDVNNPRHPAQKMHACVVAIRDRLAAMEKTVSGMGDANG